MHDSLVMHIFEGVQHLTKEESAGVFPHCAHSLAQIEEEATLDEFHDDEDKVVNHTTGWFNDLSSVTVLVHSDNSAMVEIF